MSKVNIDVDTSGQFNVYAKKPYVYNGKTYIDKYVGKDKDGNDKFIAQESPQVNGTLRRDEWKKLDEAVLGASKDRLSGIQDLRDNNLIYNLGENGMAQTVLEYHTRTDSQEAHLTMDGIVRGQNDRPTYETHYLPLPIASVDYEIKQRELMASRNQGRGIDVADAVDATYKVNAKLEEMLFTDTDFTYGGGTIYSYLNYPDINGATLSENWDAADKTGAEIIADVVNMKQKAINAKRYGPYNLYIPTAYETVLDEDYDSTTPGTTIRERILKLAGIENIKVIDTLPANTVLLVEMKSRTVRLVQGMGIQNVQWSEEGGMITKYKVMTIQVPQIRSDANGNCGIVKLA